MNVFTSLVVLSVLICQVICKSRFVTYGSVLKLMNVDYKTRLHSHDVKYGTGSGQQSVTATEQQDDVNSHWLIKGSNRAQEAPGRGEPVKCGDTIRFEHLTTGKNLHSHHFASPLSGGQEISAYGSKGKGDTGDDWIVVCNGDLWDRDDKVMLKHVDTDMYLSVSGQVFGRPINGQMEVVGTSRLSSSYWKAAEGLFIHENTFNPKEQAHHHHQHTEL